MWVSWSDLDELVVDCVAAVQGYAPILSPELNSLACLGDALARIFLRGWYNRSLIRQLRLPMLAENRSEKCRADLFYAEPMLI
jgi:hypothetical protein